MSKRMCRFDARGWCGMEHKCRMKLGTANQNCEIIPAKPKFKTIKGWADIAEDGEVNANSLHGKVRTFPCEIRIKTKYLGGK